MTPNELIRAILKARPIDLLWFGGIGTYIKASHENNARCRRPRQRRAARRRRRGARQGRRRGRQSRRHAAGRIEFARAGGRINTDFIDNSAGVDCSDHEVNIKIALAAAKSQPAT